MADNNNEKLELFTLPRTDWYDAEGRIYKDALIENFNALESKLNELNALSAFEITLPDISKINYPDTTLFSDEDAIVNLKSFLEIMNLIGYPLELDITGTTVTRLTYWSNEYKYVELKDIETGASSSKPWVILNTESKDISATSTPNSPLSDNECLIAMYSNGTLIPMNSGIFTNLNLMYLLCNMQKDTQTFTNSSSTAWKQIKNAKNSSRSIFLCDVFESGASSESVTVTDYGRKL